MRVRRAIITTLLLIFVGATSTAHANYAFQGIVSVSGGWTSNAAGSAATAGGTDGDGLFIISPSLVFTSALARAVQRLQYTFLTQLYASHPELASINNRLDWTGFFLPSPTTDLMVGAYAQHAQLNNINLATADPGVGGITRAGTLSYWGAGLTETLTWHWSPVGRLVQGAGFTAFIPQATGLGQSYTGTLSLGAHRTFRRDSFGGDLQLNYIYYGETRGPVTNSDGTIEPDGVVLPTQQQISGNFMFRWRHDFERFWVVGLGTGVATVFRATDGGGQVWQPAGEALVQYVHPRTQLELMYTRGMVPSALVQRTFVADTLTLRGTVPFPEKSRLSFTAGGTYSHNVVADALTGDTGSTVDVFFVEGSLNWQPLTWLTVFTRYQYQNQLADESQDPPIPSLERHLVLVGLIGTYPAEGAAYVPTRAPARVDRSDAVSIPDVHSEPPRR
jgi:hypothetical protein